MRLWLSICEYEFDSVEIPMNETDHFIYRISDRMLLHKPAGRTPDNTVKCCAHSIMDNAMDF